MIEIQPYQDQHWDQLWPILQEVFADGTTYAIDRNIDADSAMNYWIAQAQSVWLAMDAQQQVLGSYSMRPNAQANNDQMSHCGYVVGQAARGLGVGTALARHSLAQAKQLGYSGMQFNAVASSNTRAVQLWQKLGFQIIETREKVFPHPELGHIDAYVMAQSWP